MTAGIEVDFARKQDVPALARVLGRAFFDDPVMEWMQPHDKRRARALPRMFAAMVRHHFLAGEGVEVARRVGEMGGAALWDPPGRWKQTGAEELRMMPRLLLALGDAEEPTVVVVAEPRRQRWWAERADHRAPVEDGDIVDLGDRQFQVLHIPGHSPGSIGFWEETTGIFFSGDCIYDGPLLDGFSDSNITDYIASMKRLRDLPVRVVHAGHDPSFGRERLLELIDAYLDLRDN